MTKKINIAFDGPAASGKSAVSKAVAKRLGYLYIDTGAMYRAAAYLAVKHRTDCNDKKAMEELVKTHSIELIPDESTEKGYRITADGEDIIDKITSAEVNNIVSQVASIGEVRKLLTAKLKAMAKRKGIIMNGRDIATVVMPDAELKIYLDASLEERAKRRYKEINASGKNITFEEAKRNLILRDKTDSQREDSPLMAAADSVAIDSTNLTEQETIDKITELAERIIMER